MAARPSKWRLIGFGLGVLLLILLAVAQLFKHDLIRLQFVLTLCEPRAIATNFRNITRVLDYHTVRRSGPTYRIPYAKAPLPATYTHAGDRRELAQWLEKTATAGIIVIRDGKIAFERYYLGNDARTHWIACSASHPFISILVGFALEEGLIRSVSDMVTDYVPRLKYSGYDGVTLKDALQMASGVTFDENRADFFSDINRLKRHLALGNPTVSFIDKLDRTRPPGTYNRIAGMDTQVLAMVLRAATGQSLAAYMEEKLWSRLGVEGDAFWLVDANETELAFCGLNARLRDYARFGLLCLNEGRNFRDQQILPARWLRDSITPDRAHLMPGADNPASSHPHGYGYHWWLPSPPEGDYCAIGLYGQFIYIHPRFRVVIAKISADSHHDRYGIERETESIAVFRTIAAHMEQPP